MGKAIIVAVKLLLIDDGGSRMDPVLNDSLLILAFLAIVLAPTALALADPGPGGAGWKLLTFLCCAFAAWFFIFPSNLLIALVAWVLAWAFATVMRMSLNRHAWGSEYRQAAGVIDQLKDRPTGRSLLDW
jgi:hypothetical protein